MAAPAAPRMYSTFYADPLQWEDHEPSPLDIAATFTANNAATPATLKAAAEIRREHTPTVIALMLPGDSTKTNRSTSQGV
jgi:hypothetical protein